MIKNLSIIHIQPHDASAKLMAMYEIIQYHCN